MAYLIGLLLVLASVMLLIYPFLHRRQDEHIRRSQEGTEWLMKSYRDLLAEIKLLNQELNLTTITTIEHNQLVGDLRRRAALTLLTGEAAKKQRVEDQAIGLESIDALVEERILTLRRSKRSDIREVKDKTENIRPSASKNRSACEEDG